MGGRMDSDSHLIGRISNYDVYYSMYPDDHVLIGNFLGESKFIVSDSKDLEFYRETLINEGVINKRRKLSI